MTAGLGQKRKHSDDAEGPHAEDETSISLGSPPASTAVVPSSSPGPSTPSPFDDATAVHGGDSLGARLLLKAGYRGSGGLGRLEQGVSAALSDSVQLSTHGLGFHSVVKRQRHSYTPAPHVHIEIRPQYLVNSAGAPPSPPPSHCAVAVHDDALLTCPLYGSLALQLRLQECKSQFDSIDGRTFLSARSRCNPFELLKGEMFQNRAALKMAEVDRITERLFTGPASSPSSLLLFADICAGPGGFSEYVLTRSKWRAKGFGFTLRGGLDFRPERFNSNAPAQSFRGYYGADGTGDITRSENIRHFAAEVWRECDGLHVCMGDGGFDVAGEENKQELRSLQLILCECITALAVLRIGGAFLCKLFDVFLPFSASLLFLMHRCFDALAIIKPNQSRPANSERYLVCKGKKDHTADVLAYLYDVNDRINAVKKTPSTFPNNGDRGRTRSPPADPFPAASSDETVTMAVVSLVPEDVIAADAEFVAYLRDSNDSIAQRQIDALLRLLRYVEDPNLPSDDQERIRTQCLAYWDITDQREQDKRREQRRLGAQHEGREDGVQPGEDDDEEDLDRVGYIHYDPAWGFFHFSRYPQQGLFSLQAAERLHADLVEQLRLSRPLEPLPTDEEKDAYQRRTHSQPRHLCCAALSPPVPVSLLMSLHACAALRGAPQPPPACGSCIRSATTAGRASSCRAVVCTPSSSRPPPACSSWTTARC